jgi:inorganic pyrophosphatase/exopolyphosphatase
VCFADDVPVVTDAAAVRDLLPGDCVILVDHNVPCPSQQHLRPLVRGIVDHHAAAPDPIAIPEWPRADGDDYMTNVLNLVETIGSAASLVTRLFRATQTGLDPLLARLLLAPVLLDTSNFNPSAKKAVDGDFAARDFLLRVINAYQDPTRPFTEDDAKAYFKELSDARESYDNLSIADALRKDTKVFHFALKKSDAGAGADADASLAIPIASWGENLEQHVLKRFTMQQLLAELRVFATARAGDGAMAMFHKKGQRHVVYFARTPLCQAAFASFFAAPPGGLKFSNVTQQFVVPALADGDAAGLREFGAYMFDDATVSRKQFTPRLTEFFLEFPSTKI